MKNIAKIILLLSFGSTVFSQSPIIPIVMDNVLLGGVQDGKWLTAEQIFPKMKSESQFVLFGFQEKFGLTIGRKSHYSTCSDLADIEFEKRSKAVIALGSGAQWIPIPRLSKGISLTDKTVQKAAVDFLKSKKINTTQIEIGQALEVDFEGDGTQETIIAADYYESLNLEKRSPGDYSFVLLRKLVNGQRKNILIDGEFFNQPINLGEPVTRRVPLIADLNGDGIMEIILRAEHQEGTWHQVYQLDKDKFTKVLEVKCLS